MERTAAQSVMGNYRDLAPGDHRFFATVAADQRPFRVHVPPGVNPRLPPVIAFDGVTLFNQEGSMGSINGLDATADRYRFVAIYPMPKTRYLGILSGWNTPGGFLTQRRSYDDVDLVREICRRLGVERAYAVGFSAGGQFAHILAGRLPGIIAGVVSVSGTTLGTEPAPAPGTAAIIVHGEDDPVLAYRGGSQSWKIRILLWLGHRNILLSRPDRQIRAYVAANGYAHEPGVNETPLYVKRSFHTTGGAVVEEYVVRSPHGGHTYHGRKIGQGTESALSRGHGRPLPPDRFSINDVVAASLGFDRD